MWSMIEYDGSAFARTPIEVSEQWSRTENGVPVYSVDTYALAGCYIFQRPDADFAGKKVAVALNGDRPMAACLIDGNKVRDARYLRYDGEQDAVERARVMRDYARRNGISVADNARSKMQGLYVFGFVLTSRGGIMPAEDVPEESIAKEVVPPQTAAFVRAYQAARARQNND